jgi:outer membrane protein assembly factor BamB
MTRTIHTLSITTVVWAMLTAAVCAGQAQDNWATWRGPLGSGVSPQGNPPLTWSETQNIRWKVPVPGKGTSSPIIWNDKIFFLTAIETDREGEPAAAPDAAATTPAPSRGGRAPKNIHKFDVVCLDRATGKTLWQKTAREAVPHEGHHADHGFASYSPVTDGKLLWASFGSRGVHCYDLDGQHKWSRDLGQLRAKMAFGEGSSPALIGNALIVVMDHEGQSRIHALDKATGRTLWQKDRDEMTSWATPLGVEVGGRLQAIVNANSFVRAYDVQTGDVIWQCSGQTQNVVPTPVVGFGMVFCASGFRGSALQAIELGRTGDLTGTDAIVWQVNKATPYVPSPILYGDKLYVCSVNKAVVSCYDAKTGSPHFTEQRLAAVNDIYASPVGAAGRIYFVGRKGTTQVIPNTGSFEILATNVLDDEIDASPAVVGDQIFLKGKKSLYCIGESSGT